jgi:hypothetical protein
MACKLRRQPLNITKPHHQGNSLGLLPHLAYEHTACLYVDALVLKAHVDGPAGAPPVGGGAQGGGGLQGHTHSATHTVTLYTHRARGVEKCLEAHEGRVGVEACLLALLVLQPVLLLLQLFCCRRSRQQTMWVVVASPELPYLQQLENDVVCYCYCCKTPCASCGCYCCSRPNFGLVELAI